MPEGKTRRGILGVWDLRQAPLTLGGLIIFVEELRTEALRHQEDTIGVCLLGSEREGFREINICEAGEDELLYALPSFEGIDTCYEAGSIRAIQDFLSHDTQFGLTWPLLDVVDGLGRLNHYYGSTRSLQRFFDEHGFLPSFSMRPEVVEEARNFISHYVAPSLPVTVHLRNNSSGSGGGNANQREWYRFFKSCVAYTDVKFILIGREALDEPFRDLPNVLVAQDVGSSLTRDLALIQAGSAFMGVASGPCNLALLSDLPYVIYKNPSFHAEEMKLELGPEGRFSFAKPYQKFKQIVETSEDLEQEFSSLYCHLTSRNRQKEPRRVGQGV